MKVIVFDTETTGIPSRSLDLEFQPHICQFAAVMYECDVEAKTLVEVARMDQLIKPDTSIEYDAVRIHGITNKMVEDAPRFSEVADKIIEMFSEADVAVAHNIAFDKQVLECELLRLARKGQFLPDQTFDTMKETRDLCKLPGRHEGYKSPRLEELYRFLFGKGFEGAHNALYDVLATGDCLRELLVRGIFSPEEPVQDSLF